MYSSTFNGSVAVIKLRGQPVVEAEPTLESFKLHNGSLHPGVDGNEENNKRALTSQGVSKRPTGDG